jgi:hypothetical protein
MEMKNTESGEALLREIDASTTAAHRAAMRLILVTCTIPILFTAGLWLFAVLTN